MRQESPRDILIWDDASHIPAGSYSDTQTRVCLFLARFKTTVGHNTGSHGARLFKEKRIFRECRDRRVGFKPALVSVEDMNRCKYANKGKSFHRMERIQTHSTEISGSKKNENKKTDLLKSNKTQNL